MSKFRLTAGAALGCLITAAAVQPALAQAPTDGMSSPTQVEEIVVTAQRRKENLQSTPVAVTALTQSALQARGVQQVEDLKGVPSLHIQQITSSPSTLAINMRGDQDQNGGLATSESPVALYLDDVYQARLSAANVDLGDVERVEVLRGPQGTLYGRNSMTGAIKFITRPPDGSSWLNAQAAYGSWDEKRAVASLGGPLGDHLGGSISGLFDARDGWQWDPTLNRHVGAHTDEALRLALGLVDTGPFSAVLRLGYVHVYGDGQFITPYDGATFQAVAPGFGESLSPFPAKAHFAETSGSLNLDYKADGVTLRSITALQGASDHWQLDFSGGYVPGQPPTAGFLRDNDTMEHQFTQEFQALGDAAGGKLHYIAGLFYFDEVAHEAMRDSFGAGFFAPFEIVLLPSGMHLQSKSYAAYTQVDYRLTPDMTLTGGLRYTHDTKTFDGVIQNGFAFPFTSATVHDSLKSDIVTPKLTVSYQFTPDDMAYLTVARGYRAGGFNGLVIAAPDLFGVPYREETAWSYEGGAKSEFFEQRLRVNLAAYYEQLIDLQQTVILSGGSDLTENAARAHVEGLEYEIAAVPVEGLSLYLDGSFTANGYDRLDPSTVAAQAHAKQLPDVPHTQFQVGASYRFEPAALKGAAVLLNADYDYHSTYYSEASNSPFGLIPDSNLVNASIGLQSADGRWELIASGKNIFDQKHYFNAAPFIPGVVATKFAAEPASWMLTLKYTR